MVVVDCCGIAWGGLLLIPLLLVVIFIAYLYSETFLNLNLYTTKLVFIGKLLQFRRSGDPNIQI